MCLNPCSNGILSDLTDAVRRVVKDRSLNPCSNGILSDKFPLNRMNMPKCLNPCSNGILSD